jgi:hypothetical protein
VTRVVVAFGGNAIQADGSFDARRRTATETAASVAAAADGTDLVVTHGNGPQVGDRLLEVEASDAPDRPLDILVAETQAAIGSLLRRGLEPVLDRPVAGLLTRVVVDADDPAFDDPDKPLVPWYSEAEAAELAFGTARVGEGDRPYRRVVPSPTPESVPDAAAVRARAGTARARRPQRCSPSASTNAYWSGNAERNYYLVEPRVLVTVDDLEDVVDVGRDEAPLVHLGEGEFAPTTFDLPWVGDVLLEVDGHRAAPEPRCLPAGGLVVAVGDR